jgi:hypothetical protein
VPIGSFPQCLDPHSAGSALDLAMAGGSGGGLGYNLAAGSTEGSVLVQRSAKNPSRLLGVGILASLFLAASAAPAAEGDPPPVPLDQLLRIPASTAVDSEVARRGGNTKAQWQSRYATARQKLADVEEALELTRSELEERAGGAAWQMAGPGMGASAADSPLDYKLGQDLRRQRAELERAQRMLQELDVEANLSGVPADWRGAVEEPQESPDAP